MKELKYPPGVRFIFLLALSIFSGFLLLSIDRPAAEREMEIFYIVALFLGFPLFVISVLPWAKNCRKKTFFLGLALSILSTYFLFIDGVRYRMEWFYFLPVIALSCFVIFVSVPNQKSSPLKGFGHGFFAFALLITPILTWATITLAENGMREMILLAPVWFLVFGFISKLLGAGISNLRPNKLLTYAGECSIILSFPMLMFLMMEGYGKAIIVSFLFVFCFICINGFKARLTKIADENSPLTPLVEGSYRKPVMPTMWAENHGGRVLLIGFMALGVIGFVLGVFAPNGFLGIDTEGLHGGLMGMMSAILFPVSVILFPVILFFIGCYIVIEAILRTRRYGYLWFGLVLLLIASPFLLMAGHGVTNFLFAESKPQLEGPIDSDYYVDIEYLDELIGIDEDGDGWDAYDELITDHSDHDSNNVSSEDEVAVASKKLEELGWEEFKVTLTNNTSMVSAIMEEEQLFLDNDTEMEGGLAGGEPGNPLGMGGMGMNPMMMGMYGMGGMPEMPKFLEPGYDPSKLKGNYGLKKIHLAVLRANMDEIKTQIKGGANINAADEVGNTPLHLALGLGETNIAEWLISQGVDLNIKANDGRSMTHAAAAGGQIELLKKLVVESLKLDDKNVLGQTPLHLAVAAGQTETVEWLLKQDQKVSIQDANNNTPLHLAVTYCRADLATRLVERGADLKALNSSGQAAIHLACSTGQLGLVYWMLKLDETLINLPDGGKFTPLYHAAINGNQRTASLLLSKKAMIQAGESAELSNLFSKVLDNDTQYFDRFSRDPFQDNEMGIYGMGMNPMMMGMPGMGMPGMGMPGMGMPGMGMPGTEVPEMGEMNFEQLADLIGIDEDGDGWDAYDEIITDHSDDDPTDVPSEQELENALVKLNQIGWDELKGNLTKNTAILSGKAEEAEENKYEIFDNELVGVDEDEDGFDAWDEKITGHSDNDPADKPAGQEEVEKAQTELNAEAKKKALSDYEDAIASQRPLGGNPASIGLPSDTSTAWPSGTIEIEEPKPEEVEAIRQVDANGNSLLHLAAAIGSNGLARSIMDIDGLSVEAKNKKGLKPTDIAYALDRSKSPLFPFDYSTDGMGMNPMMMGMYGMGGMPGMGMNPMMMGMYGMGGMPSMGMNPMMMGMMGSTNKVEGMSDLPPLKEPVELSLIEWDKIQKLSSEQYEEDGFSFEDEELELIGVDEDGDGFDAYDEKITGHSDNDAEDKPTEKEVDAAHEEIDKGSVVLPPEFFHKPGNTVDAEEQNGADAYYAAITQTRDELGLRKITENRIATSSRVRSYFESVAVGPVDQWQRQKITGLFNEATDPRLGFSAIKWMEMLNFNLKLNDLANTHPQDDALRRLQFRDSSSGLGMQRGPSIHEFIKSGSEYELAFVLDRNLNIDQRDSRGRTALHIAAANGQLATVKQLLLAGANSKIVDDYGFSSLHWAAQNGELEIVRFLVEEVELKSDEDRFNREPAALAKANGHKIVSEYLINN